MGNKQLRAKTPKQRARSTPRRKAHKKSIKERRSSLFGRKKKNAKKESKKSLQVPITQATRDVRANSKTNPFDWTLDKFRAEEKPLRQLVAATNFDLSTIRKLHFVFAEISALEDDDGVIDQGELTRSMGIDDPGSVIAASFFRIFDRTQSSEINFRNWVTTLSSLSASATLEEKIKFSFQMYDSNGDGLIDLKELSVLLKDAVMENVLDLEPFQVDQICAVTFARADRDQNGLVDYHEYRKMVYQSPKFVDAFSLNIEAMMSSFRFGSHIREAPLTDQEANAKLAHFRKQKTADPPMLQSSIAYIEPVQVVEDLNTLFA